MNKIFYLLLVVVFSGLSDLITAQPCGTSGPLNCTPLGGPTGGGFENPDSIPCIIQGGAYDKSIQLTMFSTFYVSGVGTVPVDSVQFVTITNLPCGMCWSTNHANDLFAKNQFGCIRITGISQDSSGQYKLALKLNAWVNGSPTAIPVQPAQVDMAGIKMYLRVQSPSGQCNPVDTSSSFTGLTANPSRCTTGINDLYAMVPYFSIFPNPINSSATVSFIAEREARFTLKINDLAGRLISTNEIVALPGENKITIEKGSKPAGVYFISLSEGSYSLTKRFSIIE